MKSARNEAQPYLRLDKHGEIVAGNVVGMTIADALHASTLRVEYLRQVPNQIVQLDVTLATDSISVIIVPIDGGAVLLPLPASHDSRAWLIYSATVSMDGWDRPLVDAMAAAIDQLGPEQQGLLQSFDALQLIPNNMRIVASRLEPSGGPISVISENYKVSSIVLSQRLQNFVGAGSVCSHAVEMMTRLRLLMGTSAQLHLLQKQKDGSDDWRDEARWLELGIDRLHKDIPIKIDKVRNATAALNASSIEVRRLMLGLDTIRVLGRVESSRMRDAGGLSSTIDQLDTFHGEIQKRVQHIMSLSEAVRFSARYATGKRA